MAPTVATPPKVEAKPLPFFLIPPSVPKSGWALTPPSISGSFVPAEWQDAGIIPLANMGFLMMKNDAKFLYLALDVVQDTGNTPGTGDFFWLSFDVDGNAAITAHRDVNYGIYPTLPIRIGRQFYLGKAVWTGLLTDPSASLACQFFGATPKSAKPHRIWMLRIELAEIGINFANLFGPPKIRFGLRIASATPPLVQDFPVNFINDFSHLMESWLAVSPALPATKGLPIAGVGLIPVDHIHADGRATTDASYFIHAQNAAFGGAMNIIGDHNMLNSLFTQLNVRKFRVKCQTPTGDLIDLRQSWTNYRFTPQGWALESFGPDTEGKYELLKPTETYSIDHLLFQWNTTGFATGLYHLSLEFFDATGKLINVPVPQTTQAQRVPLMIDNHLPDVRIMGVKYKNQEIPACAIVKVLDTPDPVQIEFRAFDDEGDLSAFRLDAFYGDNQRVEPPLAQGSYPGTGNWQGVADTVISAPSAGPNKFPPTTCAFEFRLSATARVTNGYSYIGYVEATRHVTFERTGAPHVLATRFAKEFPVGFEPSGKILHPPKK
jgi:hypothetical protein